ncbi:hypothetical protein GSI_13281 [Ganoderma sinense ZZ0214-1]|uniref:Uncharacterized protein n=1 Tax=Ganoderma sinense ZZ0214-1 TaxID=1077348 RepID=A0A2G8RV59_9APHY|nr:hypothetical protein GSI_13281 [Ganoderma sinense ZZ0214-1]
MRLIDLVTGDFAEFNDPSKTPAYAILSHRWALDEQTYQVLREIQERCKENCRSAAEAPPPNIPSSSSRRDSSTRPLCPAAPQSIWHSDSGLSDKVRGSCEAARRDGFHYLWIDSCCIDKTSSSELSESINSMFAWYSGAEVCYTFLADVPTSSSDSLCAEGSAFRSSEWFTRGWTLQELIAPRRLVFLSQTWELLGTKSGLARLVEEITGIPLEILIDNDRLLHGWLDGCSVAQRMSWAARRRTTKVEDRAYSLLGIFNIQMPPLYGEGQGAFRRLQEEILRRIPDQTIFAWGNVFPKPFSTHPDTLRLTPAIPRPSVSYENLPGPPSPAEASLHGDHRYFNFSSGGFYALLADTPDAFADAGQVVAITPNRFHDLLRPYCRLSPQEYTSTPNGIRTDLPLLPLSSCLVPDEELFEDQDWLWSGTVEWYLAVLACQLSSVSKPEHLLCCVCCIPSPLRPVNSIYRSSLKDRRPGGSLAAESEPLPLYSIFRLSLDNKHWGSALRAHTVYLDHLARMPSYSSIDSLDVAMLEPVSLTFTLPTWCRAALEEKGYAASLEGPSDARGAFRFHRLTLTPTSCFVLDQSSPGRWSITADFSSERTPSADGDGDGDGLCIRAAVHVAGRDSNRGYTEHLQWTHARDRHEWSPGWHWGLMSGTLMLAAEGHERVRLELGVRLASASCYRIHVALDVPARRGSFHAL